LLIQDTNRNTDNPPGKLGKGHSLEDLSCSHEISVGATFKDNSCSLEVSVSTPEDETRLSSSSEEALLDKRLSPSSEEALLDTTPLPIQDTNVSYCAQSNERSSSSIDMRVGGVMKRTIMSNESEVTTTYTVLEVQGNLTPTPYGNLIDAESKSPKRKEGSVMPPQKENNCEDGHVAFNEPPILALSGKLPRTPKKCIKRASKGAHKSHGVHSSTTMKEGVLVSGPEFARMQEKVHRMEVTIKNMKFKMKQMEVTIKKFIEPDGKMGKNKTNQSKKKRKIPQATGKYTPKKNKSARDECLPTVDANFLEKPDSTMKRTISNGMCGGGGEIETLYMHQGLPRQKILDAILAKLMNESEVGRY